MKAIILQMSTISVEEAVQMLAMKNWDGGFLSTLLESRTFSEQDIITVLTQLKSYGMGPVRSLMLHFLLN